MKKILICSPVRGGLSVSYVRSVIGLLNSSLNCGPNPPYKFDFAWTSGTSVAMARAEYTNLFMDRGDDELIQWDVDLGSPNQNTMLSMFNRLLSHDVDIVGGAYVGHNFSSQWHGAASSTEAKLRPDGLLPMAQIPLGFSKVKRKVFEKVKADNPWLQYIFKETQMDKAKPGMFEYYPNGIVGPNTGTEKIKRIAAEMKDYKTHATNFTEYLDKIYEIVHDTDYGTNILLGEDFYFCKLAREAGFELFIDNNLIVPHNSDVKLPVANSDLLRSIGEEWRWGDKAVASEIEHLVEGLRSKLGSDHIPA